MMETNKNSIETRQIDFWYVSTFFHSNLFQSLEQYEIDIQFHTWKYSKNDRYLSNASEISFIQSVTYKHTHV